MKKLKKHLSFFIGYRYENIRMINFFEKKYLFCFLFIFIKNIIVFAAIDADIQTTVFYQNKKAYVEIYYTISQASEKKEKTIQHAINLTILVKKNNEIITALKYNLIPPPNSTHGTILHVERIALGEGVYDIESQFANSSKLEDNFSLINPVKVKIPSSALYLSDIQLLSIVKNISDSANPIQKNGFYYESQLFNSFNFDQRILQFYYEVYNSSNKQQELVHHYIIEKLDSNQHRHQVMDWFKKRKIDQQDPTVVKQDISQLPSGNYVLRVELQSRTGIKIEQSEIGFIRINPFWDKFVNVHYEASATKRYFEDMNMDTALYMLKAILPNVRSSDIVILNDLKKYGRNDEIKLYLYHFFHSEIKEDSTYQIYAAYKKLALEADQLFYSGFGRGFETDRGMRYMRYGKPNDIITVDQDNGAYPYEIWVYNRIDKINQSNVKFLFYNPDLAGSDFRILHSTARGDRNNPRWEPELYKRVASEIIGNSSIDATRVQDNFHRRAREYFDN